MTSCAIMLFAGTSSFPGWGRELGALRVNDLIIGGLSLLLVLIVGAIALRLGNKADDLPRPDRLFKQLCKTHGLTRSQRKMLREIARWQRLSHPARLFLEPERFLVANVSPRLARHEAELFSLRHRLFAGLAS